MASFRVLAAPVVALTLATIQACAGRSHVASEPPLYVPSKSATIPFRLVFENQMSSMFRFEALDLTLDDAALLTRQQHDLLRERIRAGATANLGIRVTPGEHVIKLRVTYVGDAPAVAGYTYAIRSSRTFTAAPDGELRIITYEQPSSPPEERPALRYSASSVR